MDISTIWGNSLKEAQDVLQEFQADSVQMANCSKFSELLIETFSNGGRVFSCGNGGSHCDAMHFAEEFTGRYRKDRRPLGALALGDASHITCTSNDYGFEHVFSRQLEGLARKGDLLLGISTSGNSQNVCNAVETAHKFGIKSVGLLGMGGGKLRDLVTLPIVVPGGTSDRIQELHIKVIHTVIESVERKLFPENY